MTTESRPALSVPRIATHRLRGMRASEMCVYYHHAGTEHPACHRALLPRPPPDHRRCTSRETPDNPAANCIRDAFRTGQCEPLILWGPATSRPREFCGRRFSLAPSSVASWLRVVMLNGELLPAFRGFLGVFEFLFAAPMTALLDEGAGASEFFFVAEEAGEVEVDVGQVQPHGAA